MICVFFVHFVVHKMPKTLQRAGGESHGLYACILCGCVCVKDLHACLCVCKFVHQKGKKWTRRERERERERWKAQIVTKPMHSNAC